MLILSHVCVDFHDAAYNTIFRITPAQLNTLIDAPDAIRKDPLFDLMVAEGSLRANLSLSDQRQLENDPTAGVTADGKEAQTAVAADTTADTATRKRPTKKSESADAG